MFFFCHCNADEYLKLHYTQANAGKVGTYDGTWAKPDWHPTEVKTYTFVADYFQF